MAYQRDRVVARIGAGVRLAAMTEHCFGQGDGNALVVHLIECAIAALTSAKTLLNNPDMDTRPD